MSVSMTVPESEAQPITVAPVVDQADPILGRYTEIRNYAQVMQQYAQAGDWDRLVDVQKKYVQAMAAVADAEAAHAMLDEHQAFRIDLLMQIRDAEQVVRDCLKTRMSELRKLMDDAGNRHHAVSAYQAARGFSWA